MSKIKIAKQIPIHILVKRILKRIIPTKQFNYTSKELRKNASEYSLNSLLDNTELEEVLNLEVINHYVNHEFDLLGSGWVNRNTKKQIHFNSSHQAFYDKTIKLVSVNYHFINWQLDVRSDFEFDVAKQFDKQNSEKTKSVDIKNCWELGRMQHLPQLAIAALSSNKRDELILEFKNQCLDFIASNPVGMGVQWACAMDVGIRVSNLLVAYDIINELDETVILNDLFNQIFMDSVFQHGLFIFNHIEFKEGKGGNHYLFNLVGLLFVSNYLIESEEINLWKRFAEHELENEFYKQFFKDGGNFEGSTAYHSLSAEAMLYGTAFMLRNNKKLSKHYIDLLFKVTRFIKDVIKPNGEIPQFGDNDSGRLFKFESENLLNYESLLAAFSGLFKGNDFDYFANNHSNQNLIIEQMLRNNKLPVSNSTKLISNFQSPIPNFKYSEITELSFPSSIKLERLAFYNYPDFGISIFKSDDFYLAISTISNKKMHHSWGHVHNDKLSFELQVNGIDIVKDSGTYTYSFSPKERNEFRSTNAHHGIIIKGIEQNKRIDLFYLDREVKCCILELGDCSITLQAKYYGVEHIRKFEIFENKLIITDYCNRKFDVNINKFGKYSPNYGARKNIKQ